MKLEHLQSELLKKGYQNSAELLTKLWTVDHFLKSVSIILKECVTSPKELADDFAILYTQLTHVTNIHEEYKSILVRDLQVILMEVLHPSEELGVLFLEANELENVITLYSNAMIGKLEAQVELGHFYRSIHRDDWAFDWFHVAAEAGNADALYWTGNYYFMGEVVEQDLERTYFCYKQAAEKGHPDALNNYADMYLRGEYVKKDETRALHLFKHAAEKGVPEAMYTLGYMYENGVGTSVDMDESRKWFMNSAHAGDVFAANRLGHEAVENGFSEEAIAWYRMAAEQGDSYGEFNLGLCYENGIGVPINLKKAKYWYQKAALKGDAQAKERLKDL